jgi:Ca-activated chloride channel family protein
VTFLWPIALTGLALIPLAVLGYILLQRRRHRYTVRFTNLDLLASLVDREPRWRRHLPPALFLAALSSLIVGLARPEATITEARERATVVLTTDTSGSMGASDVGPTRLGAAKSAANLLLDQLPAEIQVALVQFSTEARVLAPATHDRALLRAALDTLRADGQTALGDAVAFSVEVGLNAIQDDEERAPADGADRPISILLLSDGANSAGRYEPLEAAQIAVDAGIPVFTVALGTPDGIVRLVDSFGNVEIVSVPPDRDTLRRIAQQTGGRYFDAPTADDLREVYQEIGSQVGYVQEQQELTYLFAGAAGLFMLVGAGLSAFWFNRFP